MTMVNGVRRGYLPRVSLVTLVLAFSGCASVPDLTLELERCSRLLSDPAVPTQAEFINQTETRRRLSWVSRYGARTYYQTLDPGEVANQPTYVGHLWIAEKPRGRSVTTICVDAVNGRYPIDE